MTRAEAIEVLKKLIEAMQGHVTVLPTPERIAAIRLAIASLETDEAYQLEYEKPTTKNDLVAIHTEGLDEGIRCAMCTNSMANDLGCDGNCKVNNAMYKKVMDVIENQIADTNKTIEPTTKNDLGVDCIKKSDAISIIQDMHGLARADVVSDAVNKIIELPSVTPQEPFKPMVEIDLYSVIKQKYIEREVLDKIRAEIITRDRNVKAIRSDGCCFFTADEILNILDKYKAESEDT